MDQRLLRFDAETLFDKSLRKGRHLRLLDRNGSRGLPDLQSLLKVAPAAAESYVGIEHVAIEDIVGSEDRSHDFSSGFYPVHAWMRARWTGVMVHMQSTMEIEPLKLLYFGGAYFIRDGHHRVSVAKQLKFDFLTADVVRYDVPVSLPHNFHKGMTKLFVAKWRLHRDTGLFDYISESRFDVRHAKTWPKLKREIFEDNRAWFIRKNGREPVSNEELVSGWDRNLYATAVEYIERNSLHYLFPRKGTTDIFIDFVEFWNTFVDPDALWFEEVYRRFAVRARKRRFYLVLLQILSRTMKSLFEPCDAAHDRFLRATQIEEHVPRFEIPENSRRLIRFMYRQIYFHYAVYLKKKLNRAPYIQELTVHWHTHYYTLLLAHYRRRACLMNFPRFYIRFSRRNFSRFMHDPDALSGYIADFCGKCAIKPDKNT